MALGPTTKMKYDYNVSFRNRKKYIRRLYIIVVLVLLAVIGVGAAIRIDQYLERNRNTAESTTSQQTAGYFAPTTQIFRTKYFQFQTNKNWAEVPSESTDNKFVYRSLRGNLVEHDITIYVDEAPSSLAATRVLPVKLENNDSELSFAKVSEHCRGGDLKDTTAADQQTTVDKVSMLCDLDKTQYHVLVGEIGGGTVLKMRRPDGTSAQYIILYRNVTATPEPAQLYEIINSFQAR